MERQPPKDLLDYLKTLNPDTVRNLEVKHRSEYLNNHGLHITLSTRPRDTFYPQFPRSAATSEDRSCPRICTADTLAGCIIGVSSFLKSLTYALEVKVHDPKELKKNKTLFKILKFDFEWCLEPNKQLIFDTENTKEQWLVNYNEDTRSYTPILIGEIVLKGFSTFVNPNNQIRNKTNLVFYVKTKELINLTTGIVLKPGCYEVSMDATTYGRHQASDRLSFKSDDKFQVKEIEESLYNGYRKLHVLEGL